MFSSNSNYSLADIAAATGRNNNDGGFCGDSGAWWVVILFLFVFCGWGNNNGGLFGGQSTGSGITDGYILTSDFANIERKIDGVNNGVCDGFYAMNTGMLNGFAGITNQITQGTIADMQNTNAITAGITVLGNQLSQCCCDQRYENATQYDQLNYNLADQSCQIRRTIQDSTRDLIANQDANTRAILDFMTQDKIASLQAENASLKSAADNATQTNAIVSQLKPCPSPAYIVANPYCSCGQAFYS